MSLLQSTATKALVIIMHAGTVHALLTRQAQHEKCSEAGSYCRLFKYP